MQKDTNKRTLLIYWQHSKPYKKRLYAIYSLMLVAQVIEDFLQPLLISVVLTALAQNNLDKLHGPALVLILGGIVLSELTAHLIWNRFVIPLFWRTQAMIERDLDMTAFNHLQLMSARFFANRFAGSLVNQVNKFVGSFERLTEALTWNVFKLIVGLVATTIILAPRAPLLSLAIWIITIIYIPLVWRYRQRQLPLNRAWAAAETERTGQLADTVTNILAVKSFSGENTEHKLMQQKLDSVYDRSIQTMKMSMNHELVTGGVQRSLNIVVIVSSVLLAINGNVNVGLIYLALTFVVGIMRRLWDLNNTFRTLTRVFGDASDMTEILQIKPEVNDVANPRKLKIKTGEVELRNITFAHDGEEQQLFNNLDLRVKGGEKIGLVGHSGGGKTTITKLLVRFMDIQGGEILIDGENIAEVKQSDLRSIISYVPQEPLLFHRTIAENISYGKPGASQKEIEKAAKMAHADEFVQNLPNGYDTLVGERGVKLSGGQRQRVAIARALLKNAPILVLDEATSALDSESEKLIQDALWKLMEGRTAIVIAHRLSTIQKMDRIVVLENGKIAEQGSHKELLAKNGVYAGLWAHQSGGFIEE